MAGAFDFYVDESLLEQLLGGGGTAKPNKDGKSKTANSPAPVGAGMLPSPVAQPVPEPGTEPDADGAIEDPSVSAKDQPDEPDHGLLEWVLADQLFGREDFIAAAAAYRNAAELSAGDVNRASTLHYNCGLCHLRAGQLESAMETLKKSLEVAPESRSVRLALAQTCLRLNHYAEAAEHCDRVLSASPSDEDALLGKIQALSAHHSYEQAAEVCAAFQAHYPENSLGFEAALAVRAARKDRAGVEQCARELLQVEPKSKTALKVLAAVAIAERDFSAAAGYCDTLTGEDQDPDFETCLHAAETFQCAGRFEKAVNAAAKAVALDSQSFDAVLKLAESQQKLEHWDEARDHYRKAVALNPNCPDALWNLALIFEQLGSFEQATDTLTAAVRIRPEWQDASLRLASLHAASGKLQEASAVLEHCLLLRKDWPEALFLSGIVLHQLGQSGPAQDAVLKALEFKPDETDWIESLERIAVERDDALVALDCHEKLAEASIETPEMAYNLGVVLQIDNEPELAAKCYVRALEQKPDFGHALLNLGHALRELGREDEARACWGKAVRLDPSLASGYFD